MFGEIIRIEAAPIRLRMHPMAERRIPIWLKITWTVWVAVWVPLYWRVLPTLQQNRVLNVSPYGNGDHYWNAHEWSVSS